MADFAFGDDDVEARTAELLEKVEKAALDALREEMEGEEHLSPVDTRAVFEACVILSRTFPRAMEEGLEISEMVETDALIVQRPERIN